MRTDEYVALIETALLDPNQSPDLAYHAAKAISLLTRDKPNFHESVVLVEDAAGIQWDDRARQYVKCWPYEGGAWSGAESDAE